MWYLIVALLTIPSFGGGKKKITPFPRMNQSANALVCCRNKTQSCKCLQQLQRPMVHFRIPSVVRSLKKVQASQEESQVKSEENQKGSLE